MEETLITPPPQRETKGLEPESQAGEQGDAGLT